AITTSPNPIVRCSCCARSEVSLASKARELFLPAARLFVAHLGHAAGTFVPAQHPLSGRRTSRVFDRGPSPAPRTARHMGGAACCGQRFVSASEACAAACPRARRRGGPPL